jgi:hypothetical protein
MNGKGFACTRSTRQISPQYMREQSESMLSKRTQNFTSTLLKAAAAHGRLRCLGCHLLTLLVTSLQPTFNGTVYSLNNHMSHNIAAWIFAGTSRYSSI